MLALNSSTWVPSNTVWPMPTMPGRMSLTSIWVVAPEMQARHTAESHEQAERKPANRSWVDSNLREKCLLVKENGRIALTVVAQVCYRLKLQMPTSFSPAADTFQPAAPVCSWAWRWYWGSTEEASA